MASHGIKDKVAIVGMGCTPFGEHWDCSTDDLLLQASSESLASAGVTLPDVDAFWLGTHGLGTVRPDAEQAAQDPAQAGHPCRELLRHRLGGLPQRVLRRGVRCLRRRDGHRRGEAEGLRLLRPRRLGPAHDGTAVTVTAPASFSFLAPAYAKKYGVDEAR